MKQTTDNTQTPDYIKWWNELPRFDGYSGNNKITLMAKYCGKGTPYYYQNRQTDDLTNGEIEQIYLSEHPETKKEASFSLIPELQKLVLEEMNEMEAMSYKLYMLLYDLTPGGSEFANDPEYCAKWIRENRQQEAKILKEMVKAAKEKNEALQDKNKHLIEVLVDLMERANRARAILQDPKGIHHGYWGMLDTEKAKEAIQNNQL
ncbi:MAG: hypothetical protein V4538_15365 [Bacteroidota bacterium]